MGKEELLDALAGLQAATSVERISAQFLVIHEALSDIHRKRWKFLEDSCSVVLRQVLGLVSTFDDDVMKDIDTRQGTVSSREGLNLSLQFIEPLIHSTVSIVDALEDENEAANQRAVLVAALLHLFAKFSGVSGVGDLRSRLVADVLRCGVELHVILATFRFREELVECRRALLPSYESDSDTESELDLDDDEEMGDDTDEFTREDTQWITDQVAKVWGLTRFKYFLQTAGQEYAFSAWSYRGIGDFVHTLLTDEQHGPNALSVVVSPFSWLFHVAAYSHYMIHSEHHQERWRGLELLQVAVGLCPPGKLALPAIQKSNSEKDKPQSFREQSASLRSKDWMSPLIQVITNAMVSFPEPKDRSATLAVLKYLVSKVSPIDRFWLLQGLILQCPYGNVAAVLVDFVRGDAVQAWYSSDKSQQSPFKTSAIRLLLQDALAQAAERDLVLHADLVASCLSLLRFLYIRDKDNETGIRTKTTDCTIWEVLARFSKRLQVKIEETVSGHGGEGGSHSVDNDFTHLMILEASLGSTLELCN
ncbi:hypothetical protein PF010_g14492 [Phytophthora fragariae]|uniref:Uncharacterized protein n=1 Tax=Phytophthora fragariae TaxID=53985 RepID=A0A6G0NQE8_9STRA|nr:hypothetical protein PF010_g14492 [Phytophthora fragariae]KAE9217880.1 hypothetical protein PF004_g14025 [Phytophthora fragariae]